MYNFSRYQAKNWRWLTWSGKNTICRRRNFAAAESSERSSEHLLKHGSEMPRDVLVKA